MASIALEFAAAAALTLLWYLLFQRLNRRKAIAVLQRLRNAFAGDAQIIGVNWTGASHFSVRLRVPSSGFQQARVSVHLRPREMPIRWLAAWFRKKQETLTFDADLDFPPAFNLEVHNHRWCGRTRKFPRNMRRLALDHCGPFVLTTRNDWQREITAMMSALVASRDCDFVSVSFRRQSPHFSATVPLNSLLPESNCGSQMLDVLRELASCSQVRL